MTTSFRQAAEARVAELEQRDKDRRVHAEEKAVRSRAADAAAADRRAAAGRERWQRVDAAARDKLAGRFGHKGAKAVNLDIEYRVFVIGDVAIAVSHGDEPTSRNGRHLTGNHSPAWRAQHRVQNLVGVNPGLAVLLEGRHLWRADPGAAVLVVDPSDDELRRLR